MLSDFYPNAGALKTTVREKQLCGLHGEIALIGWNKAQIAIGAADTVSGKRKAKLVAESDRLHYHQHIVVSVGASARDVKGDIYFCIGFFADTFHRSNSMDISATPELTCGPCAPPSSV